MKVAQIAEAVNQIVKEEMGLDIVIEEDLSNIVNLGTELENMTDGYENFAGKLHDHIGLMIFVDRIYRSGMPDIRKESFEFGSIIEKVDAEPGEFRENDSWQLQDGHSYDQDIFYGTEVSSLWWNGATTFEIRYSRVNDQVKSAFSNASQFVRFWGMIEVKVRNKITLAMEALTRRLYNAMTAETLYDAFPSGEYSKGSTVRAVNLLYLYNQSHGTSLTVKNCMENLDWLKFATKTIWMTLDRMKDQSVRYNIKGKTRFTPADRLQLLVLSEFQRDADMYLQADTWHNDFVKLPGGYTISHWQGAGEDPNFDSESAIDVKTPTGHVVKASGILAIACDWDALGIYNDQPKTLAHNTELEEFTTYKYSQKASYYADTGENYVVFFIA